MTAILSVAVPVPLPQLFDYLAPPDCTPEVGCRVLIPFGRGHRVGIVVGASNHSDVPRERLKAVVDVLDSTPLLSGELLTTLQWAARYYQHPLGAVLEAALPVVLRQAKPIPLEGPRALALTAAGVACADAPPIRQGSRIRQLFDCLVASACSYEQLDVVLPGWRASAASLRQRGLAHTVAVNPQEDVAGSELPLVLGDEQQLAVDTIDAVFGTFTPFLLEGVTGSGKTEVYLQAIQRTLARGDQALVLVPEIGLTPQTMRRFRARFGSSVRALHSGLADGERTRAWLAAARGDARVILGTRSAIFAPLPRLGLIVVDEEHDASYKQQEGFRYSARDLAVVRAHALNVPVLLGSATPSLESLANVNAGRYQLLRLSARAGNARAPLMRVVDQRRARMREGMSPELITALRSCLGRGEQALIFRNRRGYAPVLLCHDCGWNALCARCDRALTWHRGRARLVCHHCGAERPVPAHCPECNSTALQPQGHGTERLEEALLELFPTTPVLRIDRETTRRRGSLEALFDRLGPEQPGIYVGTQMLAKGHDLPNLTLVAILGVDEGLHSVDFRAAERLGQLVIQVAGRAGRAAKAGEVLLQTHHPDHALLASLLRGGYRALAQALLQERRIAEMPPFSHMALLRAEAKSVDHCQAFLAAALDVAEKPEAIEMLGPLPAPMPLRAGMHRAQLLANAAERSRLQAFLPAWIDRLRALPAARRVRWSIDVDPIDLY
ncbi:MAG: primosomal protein N' [Tahibacter sp.]